MAHGSPRWTLPNPGAQPEVEYIDYFFWIHLRIGLHRFLYILRAKKSGNRPHSEAANVHTDSSSCNGRSAVCRAVGGVSTDMPMKVKYTVLDGEIISENRGGTISDYVPDSLGSTRFLLGAGQAITDSWNYYPFGEAVHVTGTNPTPMQFVGTQGYYQDATANTYVRARVLKPQQARWLTEDLIGMTDDGPNLYTYAADTPTTLTDRSGLQAAKICPCGCYRFVCSCPSYTCTYRCNSGKPITFYPPKQSNHLTIKGKTITLLPSYPAVQYWCEYTNCVPIKGQSPHCLSNRSWRSKTTPKQEPCRSVTVTF